jgi:hypothetical protein
LLQHCRCLCRCQSRWAAQCQNRQLPYQETLTDNIVEEESQAESAKCEEAAVFVDNEEVAKQAMMAEKAIIALAPEKKVKKHKRPRLAKWSKIIFGKRKKAVPQF